MGFNPVFSGDFEFGLTGHREITLTKCINVTFDKQILYVVTNTILTYVSSVSQVCSSHLHYCSICLSSIRISFYEIIFSKLQDYS